VELALIKSIQDKVFALPAQPLALQTNIQIPTAPQLPIGYAIAAHLIVTVME
jgi:hypothetical protein